MRPKQQAAKPVTKIVLPDGSTTLELSSDRTTLSITQLGTNQLHVILIKRAQFPTFIKALLELYGQFRDDSTQSEPKLTATKAGLLVTKTADGMSLFVPREQLDVFLQALLAMFVNNEPEDGGTL